MTRTQASGRSLIEMLGVLAIMGVLTVGALAGIDAISLKMKVTKMGNQMQQIADEIAQTYSWMRSYPTTANLTNQTLCNNGIAFMCDPCTASSCTFFKNPFGGRYSVSSRSSDNTLTVTATGVSTEGCTQLCTDATIWPNISSCDSATCAVTFE